MPPTSQKPTPTAKKVTRSAQPASVLKEPPPQIPDEESHELANGTANQVQPVPSMTQQSTCKSLEELSSNDINF